MADEERGRGDRLVLIVDDIPMFRELEQLFLSRFARVLPAASVREALDCLARETPDLVVLDYRLPDAPAETVVRALRASPATRETPVVMITTGSARDHERAIRAGAADVVAKPLSRTVLVESVRRFLRAPRGRGLPRVPLAAPVRIRNGEQETWGLVRNLSRGGMFIESRWLPPADTELDLCFRLEANAPALQSTAKLVWRRLRPNGGPTGIGVRFLALDRDTWGQLDRFVHERLDVPEGGLAAVGSPGLPPG